MKGLRKIAPRKPPCVRPGLDDPAHKARVRQMACVLRGKRCILGKWIGVYPEKKWVEQEYLHVCQGPIDPHHTQKKSQRGHDHTCVPMCRAGHDEAEKLTNEQFKAKWGVALPVIASQLAAKADEKLTDEELARKYVSRRALTKAEKEHAKKVAL